MDYQELENGPFMLAYSQGSGVCQTEVFDTLHKAKKFRQALRDHCNVKQCRIFELVEVITSEA